MRTVLTIAGFDPSSGAGITADLLVFAAHGVFGISCITSLTVQSTLGVRSSHPVDATIVAETLAFLTEDLPPAGIKIGMLGSVEAVEAVSTFIERVKIADPYATVVVDPVIRSSSGRELLDARGLDLLQSRLLPFADWITPNLDELAALTGQSATDRDQMLSAAMVLQQTLKRKINVLVTGGHLDAPDDLLLTAQGTHHWLTGERIVTDSTHGTGCAFSSALLSRLVLGDDPLSAARSAKCYIIEALRSATPIGHGKGPVNHLWPLRQP
jgi:hydroxymethylpyrimidine/phosphomethylpyrimidine kinase